MPVPVMAKRLGELTFAPMIIAVNTRILSGNYAFASLLKTCFEAIARQHPEHSFAFISNEKSNSQPTGLQNISHHIIEQHSASPLLWRLWYNYKLPALLRKLNADVLVNAEGLCSLKTRLPQIVFLNELISKKAEGWYSKKYLRFMLTHQSAFLQKAAHVLAATNILRQQLTRQYKIDDNKISILYPVADEHYQPLVWEQKEQVKEQYTQGKDYFLFACALQQRSNLINLLKAFSFFKRRQKSNMQLVIVAGKTTDDDGFTTSLETYKYRKEVVLLKETQSSELQHIMAAAYAFISPSLQENNCSNLVNALQCNVPVLINNTETNKELFAEAALYADVTSFEDIADKMMLLFKDEDRRARYIEQGKQQLQNFSSQKTVDALWQTILTAIQ